MKKGQYYFEKMPKVFQEMFLKNLKNYSVDRSSHLKETFDSFSFFIYCSFIWQNTQQGHDFWEAVAAEEIK